MLKLYNPNTWKYFICTNRKENLRGEDLRLSKKKKSKHAPFSLCTVCYDCICLFYDTVLNYGLDFVLDWFHDVHSHCVHKTVINRQT